MNTHVTLALVAALTGCAAPAPQAQPAPQATACHTQLTNQRLFMLIAGRDLQKCIDRPSSGTCGDAITTMKLQDSLGIDHELFRSCFPEYMRTERDSFKETAVELSVFQKKLAKVSDIFNKASKVGHL